jgi:hypothetical protein
MEFHLPCFVGILESDSGGFHKTVSRIASGLPTIQELWAS